MSEYVACLDPPLIPAEDSGDLSLGSVILDTTAYISSAALSNAAAAKLSTGVPIEVSFCLARPPRLSYLCVHFSGPVFGPGVGTVSGPVAGTPAVQCVRDPPLVISTHADRALIRVCIPGSLCINNHRTFDYFVYTARPQGPSLDRLPKPNGFPRFRDQDVAVVSCSGDRYVIAALRTLRRKEFTLQLYDSDTDRWTSTNLPLLAPERDTVLPIPDSATEQIFHNTTKTITLESTTVGWVDLWRGILFCNVLDEKPVLRDMPLPKPSRCNRGSFCMGGPYGHRDITVVALPGLPQVNTIKFVEMGTRVVLSSRRQLVKHSSSASSSDDDDDDVDHYWTATVWSMPVPIASWKDWRKDCIIDAANIIIDNPRHSKLLRNALPRLTVDPEEASVTSLRRMLTGHPVLGHGMNGDLVIYLLSKVDYMACEGWVIAVGTRDTKLQGITKLDDRKNFSFARYYCATDMSRYLTKAAANGDNVAKCGAAAVYNRQAGEEMEGSDQVGQARGQLWCLGATKEGSETAKNHVEPHNTYTSSIMFGNFSSGKILALAQQRDKLVNPRNGGPSPNQV